MDSHAKRLLTFALLAIPMYVGFMVYMTKTQKARQEYLKQQQGEQIAESPEAAAPTGTPQSTPDAVLEPALDAPIERETEAPELRPADVAPVEIETEEFIIHFSPVGGVPTRWDIIDPEYVFSEEQKKNGDNGGEIGRNDYVRLIDERLAEVGAPLPFQVVLKELNARFYNELNSQVYETRRVSEANHEVVEFVSSPTESGLQLVKTYRIPHRGFTAEYTLRLVNRGQSRLSFNYQGHGLGVTLGPGLNAPITDVGGLFGGGYAFVHPFYKVADGIEEVRKTTLGEAKAFVRPDAGIHWAGIHSRYFMMTLIPDAESSAGRGFTAGITRIDRRVAESALWNEKELTYFPLLELYQPEFAIEPGQEATYAYTIFAGPKESDVLEQAGQALDSILFYDMWNWMRWLCFILMGMLNGFHAVLRNWGLAIVALVVTVRLITFPLAHIGLKHQAKTMAQQAKLKPYLDKINEKHKDNPQKRSQEMMKLYREHNVNPLGAFKGCLWMLIQLPIFWALYRLLSQSFDLRGASFLWINDLSQPDHLFRLPMALPLIGEYFNLLPILTAVTQMLMSKLSMRPDAIADPTQASMQKQMMYMMPFMILFITYTFPSGLVLYWFISNLWQVFQQRFVNRKILPPPGKAPAPAAQKA